MVDYNNCVEVFGIGHKVDSVGGIWFNGTVRGVRKVGNITLLKIEWPNGVIQERSSGIVRKAK